MMQQSEPTIRQCDTTPLHTNYDALTPDTVMDAIEQCGYLADARIIALNSYENRVYQVGVEGDEPVVAKFYRPNRWSNEQINEEHVFCQTLTDAEIPVISPLNIESHTLHQFRGYRFALYPRRGGYAPELGNFDQLHFLGRLLGRIHAIGAVETFQYRPTLSVDAFCRDASQQLLRLEMIPAHLIDSYQEVTDTIANRVDALIAATTGLQWLRTHSDCHLGNILWHRDKGPHFVDFDDCRMTPAVQDLWMLLAGDHVQRSHQLSELLEGYTEFHSFNGAEIRLIEGFRALRLVHYTAWLGQRWSDPAFPIAFTWFNTPHYWEQHISELQEQVSLIDADPLTWY